MYRKIPRARKERGREREREREREGGGRERREIGREREGEGERKRNEVNNMVTTPGRFQSMQIAGLLHEECGRRGRTILNVTTVNTVA